MIGAYMAFSLSALTGSLFMAIAACAVGDSGRRAEWGSFASVQTRSPRAGALTYGLILVSRSCGA
jgi:hypothetical protein